MASFSGFQISKSMREAAFYFRILNGRGDIVTMPTLLVLHMVKMQAGAERQLQWSPA